METAQWNPQKRDKYLKLELVEQQDEDKAYLTDQPLIHNFRMTCVERNH